MDIVIEGKITPDEGLGEVIQTVLDLKNVPNAVLRITSSQGDLQGRIGFAQGGFILGGKVSSPEETGYPALRKLLSIQNGTYAILDPGRTQMSDVNQTLWIKAARVIDMLPELPESPQLLLEGVDLDTINTSVDKAQLDPMDLKVAKHETGDVVRGKESKTRQHDAAGARNARLFMVLFLSLLVAVGIVQYWDTIVGLFIFNKYARTGKYFRTGGLTALLVVFCAFPSAAQLDLDSLGDTGGGTVKLPGFPLKSLAVGRLKREYHVHLPPRYRPGSRVPVLLLFHGAGGTGLGMEKLTHMSVESDRHGYLLVLPDGLSNRWNDGRQLGRWNDGSELPGRLGDDVAFVNSLIEELKRSYSINESRIYAAGISNGGFFSQYFCARAPGKLAAIASVAATITLSLYQEGPPPHPVPIVYFFGTDDPIVPYEGGTVSLGPIDVGESASAEKAVHFWVKANRCNPVPNTTKLPTLTKSDGTSVIRKEFRSDKGEGDVVEYIIKDGGHAWPGGKQYMPEALVGIASRQLDANRVIIDFFDHHRR